MELRVQFAKGRQREFLNYVKERAMAYSLRDLLQIGFDVSYSSLKKYYNEKLLLPKSFFENLCHIAKIDPNALEVKYLEGNWGQSKGGKKGSAALLKKYPNEIKEWRKLANKNSVKSHLKQIKIPELNEKLSEFIGAYLGDGTLTPYFVRITGDSRYDWPYHDYLARLVLDLFGLKSSIKKEKDSNTLNFRVYSVKLCSFLNKKYKLSYGDKIRNQTKIPSEIMQNRNLALACLRGLMDTDGSISRRGRNGDQFCLQFTNHNKTLLDQVISLGHKLEIFTFFAKDGTGTNSWAKILRYFTIVGSSNLKHVIRFDLRLKGTRIYARDIEKYLEQDLYKDLSLPFKLALGL